LIVSIELVVRFHIYLPVLLPQNRKRIRQLTPHPFQNRVWLTFILVIPTGFEPVLPAWEAA